MASNYRKSILAKCFTGRIRQWCCLQFAKPEFHHNMIIGNDRRQARRHCLVFGSTFLVLLTHIHISMSSRAHSARYVQKLIRADVWRNERHNNNELRQRNNSHKRLAIGPVEEWRNKWWKKRRKERKKISNTRNYHEWIRVGTNITTRTQSIPMKCCLNKIHPTEIPASVRFLFFSFFETAKCDSIQHAIAGIANRERHLPHNTIAWRWREESKYFSPPFRLAGWLAGSPALSQCSRHWKKSKRKTEYIRKCS